MNPVMYILANKGLGMSAGKLAAQVGHAAVRAYILSTFGTNGVVTEDQLALTGEWLENGETKVVIECRDTEHLLSAQKYIESKGFLTYLIVDEGRTEIDPHSPTALGVQVVDKADRKVAAAFADFRTYRDQIKVTLDIDR